MQPISSRSKQVCRLIMCLLAVAIVWLGVLPQIGNVPAIKAYIENNQAKGIDPGVRYYSELPCMAEMIDRIDALHRRHRSSLWTPEFQD